MGLALVGLGVFGRVFSFTSGVGHVRFDTDCPGAAPPPPPPHGASAQLLALQLHAFLCVMWMVLAFSPRGLRQGAFGAGEGGPALSGGLGLPAVAARARQPHSLARARSPPYTSGHLSHNNGSRGGRTSSVGVRGGVGGPSEEEHGEDESRPEPGQREIGNEREHDERDDACGLKLVLGAS